MALPSTTNRLRSRSLINSGNSKGIVGSTSALTAHISSPLADGTPDSQATSPNPTELVLTATPASSARPRSASVDLYPPLSNTLDVSGKGKQKAELEPITHQAPFLTRKPSWFAVSVPFTTSPALHNRSPSESLASTSLSPEQVGVYSLLQPLGILTSVFAASTAVVVYSISTVPTLAIPHDLAGVLEQGVALKRYSLTSPQASVHILGVLTVLFVYKQAFSIPGSLLTNILFGSLYGVFWSTLITSILTAIGSLLCYFMAYKLSPLVRYFFPKPLAFVEKNLAKRTSNPSDLFSYLLLMRLFPLLPYAALNVAGGVLAIAPGPFFWSLVLGSIPYNLCTVSVGDLISSVPPGTAELSSIWTPSLFAKLLLISSVSALPILFKSHIQALLGGKHEIDLEASDESDNETDALTRPLRTRKTASLIAEGPFEELEALAEERRPFIGVPTGW